MRDVVVVVEDAINQGVFLDVVALRVLLDVGQHCGARCFCTDVP